MAMSPDERRRRSAENARRWHAANRDRARAASAKYRANNPERVKWNMYVAKLRRYGLTPEDYDRMLAEQGGGCAICACTTPNGNGGRFDVDHDHACCPGDSSCGVCVRGLLCRKCNIALGSWDDDPARLRRAAAYLEAYER